MGAGMYSLADRSVRSERLGFATAPVEKIFKQRNINNAMSPEGVKLRESRDSEEHPASLAIILGLDVTGSMGTVPHFLVKEGLPHIMETIIARGGIADPQVLFLGIGDHTCDKAPLQVGQFESNDELLDKWLTDIWLEGQGGGNNGESYMLAWYFAAQRTEIDCLDKRGLKGFLFTIGDEPVLSDIPAGSLHNIMGGDSGEYATHTAAALMAAASEKYHVFHIHIKETASGGRQEVIDGWRQLLSDKLIVAEHKEDVAQLIANTIMANYDVDSILPAAEAPDRVIRGGGDAI